MGALDQFEVFLRELLERPAWLMSRHRLEPLEVASALTRELEARVQRDGSRILIPSDYDVLVAQDDLLRLGPSLANLEHEMTAYVQRIAAERVLTLQKTPAVRILAGSDLLPGQIQVKGSFARDARSVYSVPLASAGVRRTGSAALTLLGQDDSEIDRFALEERSMTLGRRSDNDIALDDSKISRHHARLEFEAGTFYLTDLASTNGTRVNGKEIAARCALETEDVIEVGLHRFRFSR